MFGPTMSQPDSTILNVSLSALSRQFDAPLDTVQWVFSGYPHALDLVIPLSGWLVDRVGSKRRTLAVLPALLRHQHCAEWRSPPMISLSSVRYRGSQAACWPRWRK
jgi:MFS family permease